MSLYSQNHAYGQVAYPALGYPQPGLSAYPYQQPPAPAPPAPVYYVDPNSFRRDYTARLAELTINSRPIIQNLSMVAQEYSRWAEVVAQCLENHIRRVPPWMKLPAFYLLDAISKNVYEPYGRHFAAYVIPLFLESYEQVDQNTRSKMEEMLLTWRTGAPNGKELFGFVPQLALERGVWGESSATDSSSSTLSGSGQISKAQVLSELEYTLGQKERALHSNPYDTAAAKHVDVLLQLRKLVEAGVSQKELRQILGQLRAMGRTSGPPSQPPSTVAPYPSSSYTQSYPVPVSQPSYSHSMQPSFSPSAPSAYSYNSQNQPKIEQTTLSSLLQPPEAPSSSSNNITGVPPTNIANLFSALLKAGVVSASGTPTGAGATAKPEGSSVAPMDMGREASREYRKSILKHSIKLTTSDITKMRSPIVHFLFDRLPVQCKQCGIRYADNATGRKDMEDHLDMHFRQNRKANQNIGRGHSRSWFVGIEDWIHDTSIDMKGKGRADGSRPLNVKAAAAAEAAKREAELREQFVVVPPGDEAKSISCPICKETLKSEFLEDDEDWVWKNAVKKDDRIFHATCHAEASTSVHSLAARLRNEVAGRSRSGTPEGPSLRLTPPKGVSTLRISHSPSPDSKLAGTKRKAVNDDPNSDASLQYEHDATPPMKRLALSVLS
ncbi:hypothetical protein SERLA73DRAFT_159205 [Serpula lacrymans var. lacrymans S7.3]|uniref:CID domain-containing protein n=2 Tax=Serpula lacrymans var. lacrymans TaxID=341189 RepID=F8PQ87_SERL3|nr:uncharacterized protein SERLADRAFT_447029 [Serpula lacrymans var. lacrymans S7.9]EGO02188.1 hypothetical protein SERLA73DRAFT_159205 [Serpula lacrymans var. lacrymans S7.3]EGO27811.1 hypothetical protein SERLADRAFT_447029 [Serpula lacrymans var. lacrymans S7.9]